MIGQRRYDINAALSMMQYDLAQLTKANLSEFYEKARRFLEPKGSQFSYRFRERRHGKKQDWTRIHDLLTYEQIKHDPSKDLYTIVFMEAQHQRFDIHGLPLYFAFDEAKSLWTIVDKGETVSEELYVRKSTTLVFAESPPISRSAPHIARLPLS